jgi:hypothetical protein
MRPTRYGVIFADAVLAVFRHQETKFVGNALGKHFIQLYFEEAHNLFPPDSKDLTGVYARFAKEGKISYQDGVLDSVAFDH